MAGWQKLSIRHNLFIIKVIKPINYKNMNKCPFCLENKIPKGKILTENNLCYFVESIDPVLDCGGMIVPKRHVGSPFELTTEEWLATKDLLNKIKILQLLDKIYRKLLRKNMLF